MTSLVPTIEKTGKGGVARSTSGAGGGRSDLLQEVDRILLSKYAPAGVLVNEALEILQFRGHTSSYLEPPAGQPSLNILKMAREGLLMELRVAIDTVRKRNTPVKRERLSVKQDGEFALVNLEVIPVSGPDRELNYLVLLVEDAAATGLDPPAATTPAARTTGRNGAMGAGTSGTAGGLNPRYTFDNFIVGSSNQFARAACQAVAELPSRAYNPLFIYGGVGLGKTHLLHAVGHQSGRLFPGMEVVYLSCEHFTNALIDAIRHDRTADFRARYRAVDLLLIDDVQFIAGKERTQEELFHTFNDLYDSRKQIMISSDSSPKNIPEIEERLRSRFEWGLIADIQPPDFETRIAILQNKAALERVLLADDAVYLIASRIKSNIRKLEGSLTRMLALCALTGREMTKDLAQEVLSDLWGEEERTITVELIQEKVSEFFGVTLSDLKAKDRTKAVAFRRQITMYLARQLTHASLAEVGRAFGGKDHTTVLHAVDKIQTLLQQDPQLRTTIDRLIQGITS